MTKPIKRAIGQQFNAVRLTDLRQPAALKDALPDSAGTNLLGLADAAGSLVVGSTTNNSSVTEKAAYLLEVPEQWIQSNPIQITIRAKISANRQVAQTIDLVAKRYTDAGLGNDICSTAAQNLTTSFVDYTFSIDQETVVNRDVIYLEIAGAADDTGGATNGNISIASVSYFLNANYK